MGLPEPHALAVMVLTAVALLLFTRERIPLETSSLIVLLLLALGFELFPYQAANGPVKSTDFFHGFGHEALIAVTSLMIAGHGLVRTGALDPVGRALAQHWKRSPSISLLFTLVVAAFLSAFINNTPIVVLLLPVLVNIGLRTRTHPSGMLMPMGFATLIGGMATTIGTSTNLLVVGVAADLGVRKFGIFDFIVPAALSGGIGILYLWLIAPRILPQREVVADDASPRLFRACLKLRSDSPLIDQPFATALEKCGDDLKVQTIQRGDSNFLMALPDVKLRAGDEFIVTDTPTNLKEFETLLGATLRSGGKAVSDTNPLQAGDQQIAEVIVFPGSPLENETLADIHLADHFHISILALHPAGQEGTSVPRNISNVRLNVGDVLLVQGPRENISALRNNPDFMVLDATTDLPYTHKATVAILTMLGIVLTAASGVLPISLSAPLGVLIMLMSGCMNWHDISQAVSAQVILIIVASLALGNALLFTGGSEYLANLFIELTHGAPPNVLLSSLILLMAILTNVVSNNAAAVIGAPIAISIAQQLSLPPEPFVLAVLFGANMSFGTPMAYQTNLLVMSAGNYRFMDFVRVGLPLIIILWLTLSWILPMLYSIEPTLQ